ncbi:MAG TPA: VTT domain-containing protein [Longimicrobiaceae bacterium]|nr:VTT domain-containing protein [Longimicrobiaceae bacterium]
MSSPGQMVLDWLESYGYLGVGVGVLLESAGLPVPGETAVLAAAFAASQGRLSLPLVVAVAAVGGVLGDNLGYWVGRWMGRPWLLHHGRWLMLTPARLARMDRFFDRFGAAAIVVARFVTGVRVVAALAAGVAELRWRVFFLYNVIGAILWATAVGLVGFYFGHGWQVVLRHLGPTSTLLVAISPLVVLTVWIFWQFRTRVFRAGEAGDTRALAWEWVWILVVALTAIAIFAQASAGAASPRPSVLDLAVRRWAPRGRSPALDVIFGGVTLLGSGWMVLPIAAAAAAWQARRRRTAALAAVLVGGAAALVAAPAIKLLFGELGMGAAARGFSFPSAHTTAATVLFPTLAYVLWRDGVVGRSAFVAAGLVAAGVGVSRVYFGLHWASDVIGGWAVGLFLATLAAAVYERLR